LADSLVGSFMIESGPSAPGGTAVSTHGEWVVTLDVENPTDPAANGELVVRALAVAVAGSRTYVSARHSGYSFTVIVGTAGAEPALARALSLLSVAQRRAGLPDGIVVCAEVTLVDTLPLPAADGPVTGCENPAP
jgi:hypothetical protein